MQLIPTRVHGMMDYLVGLLLVAAPWIFDFNHGGAETWVPVVLGLGVIMYSLFTDYELGIVRKIPMPTHLRLDLAGGVLLALSPWLFGFADTVRTPHLVIGLIEVGTVLMSQRHPADASRNTDRAERAPRTSGAHG